MRAIRFHEYGPPSVLRLDEVEVPIPKSDEVLIRVQASSVNYTDMGMRRGDIKVATFWRLPIIPGFDVAGEIIQCGPEVTAFLPGQKVYALTGIQGGGQAEYVCLAQKKIGHAPHSISLSQSAAVPLAGLTALQALRGKGHVQPKQRVLINGASGGVGSFAVQIAKFFQCHTTAIVSGEKLDFVRQLGADEVINYKETDFTKLPQQWDLVFDAAGNREFADVRPVLSGTGSMVTTRIKPSGILDIATSALFNGQRFDFLMTKESGQDLDFLSKLIDQGAIHPAIDKVFPWTEAVAAHQYVEEGKVNGKIVLEIGSD